MKDAKSLIIFQRLNIGCAKQSEKFSAWEIPLIYLAIWALRLVIMEEKLGSVIKMEKNLYV